MESTPCEDAVKKVELATKKKKKIEYYMNLVDKAVVGLERIDSNFGKRSAVGKMPSNSTSGY